MSFLRADSELARHSYYATTAARTQRHAALASDIDCDVAVVGGGLAGLSAAVELAERGYSVVVLEARQAGWGASGRNGGQAIAGLACEQATIAAQLGLDEARRVWAMTVEALNLIRQRCARYDIDCDWRSGYLNLATSARKAQALRVWHEHMWAVYAHETTWIPQGDMPRWIASPRFHGATHDTRSGHLHPLKYCLGVARAATGLGVRVYEETRVTGISPGPVVRLQTASGQVRASHVLLAGNVYLQGLAPPLERRIMPVGTYIVTSAPLAPSLARSLIPSQSAACDTNFVLDYFRPTADHRLLYGGRVSYTTATPRDLAASMQRRMAGTFPQLKDTPAEFAWGGFVDITMNRAPDFGRLADVLGERVPAPGAPRAWGNVYYLQGFSGHGLALTGLAGKLVAEAIDGDASRFDTFARIRHRNFPGGRLLRTPALVLGMAYHRLRDLW